MVFVYKKRYLFISNSGTNNIMETVSIEYNIHKHNLERIVEYILPNRCNIKLFGYVVKEDSYWCKKMKKTKCEFLVRISIRRLDFKKSVITLEHQIGKKEDAREFINIFKRAMKLYYDPQFVTYPPCPQLSPF
jgi:uncharacterized metal-binding protein